MITTLVGPPYSVEARLDDFHGLDRIEGYLIREDFALLIGDWLAIDGEGVGGVVAQAVEETVGIGRDAGRGKRDQGTERRRGAF